ncbi:GNAT family N-acetyltransferase [Burkholderia sp. BCC1630]|uniref:GNAT family N-acetyltransferase n=1 Tax=Burkholderia sp. BCC1630 TaxID=2676304 RepID=UPI00158ADD6B|nr:GNAT family N-acetyltransferase [Burkholderia sp. BCC1630]
MKLECKRLTEVDVKEVVALNSNPLVLRHMPLAENTFDERKCLAWILEKESQWARHGYGPLAFFVDGKFAGWGGLQHESGDADLALVLLPEYWGMGHVIYQQIISMAFSQMGLASITALLPDTRRQRKSMQRLGFINDGETELCGNRFIRYRLYAQGE